MTDYFYDMDLVVDPLNPSNVVANGSVAIYDPADTAGTTLLVLKDPSGLPLPNPLTSNANGFLPPRIAQVPQTMWKSGGFTGYFNSYKGLRDEAVQAVTAAQGAANTAATAAAQTVTTAAVDGAGKLILTKADGATVDAGNVKGAKGDKGDKGDKGVDGANVLPTQEAIAQAVTSDGPAKTALSATYARPTVLGTAVLFGDSITHRNGPGPFPNNGETATYNRAMGYFTWANILVGQKLRVLKNAGIGGNNTAQMLARVDTDVLPFNPGWCFFLGGVNDGLDNTPATTTIANVSAIFDKLSAANIRIVALTPWPGGTATLAQRAELFKFSEWLRAQQGVRKNFTLVDTAAVIIDPATGAPPAQFAADFLHPDPDGAAVLGRVVAAAIEPLLTGVSSGLISSNDESNLLTNGMFVGNSSGMAPGWGFESYTGVRTRSKVPRTDGRLGEWQQVSATDGLAGLYATTTTGFTAGADIVYGDCEFEADDDWSATTRFDLNVEFTGGIAGSAVVRSSDLAGVPGDAALTTIPRKGVLRTPRILVPAGTTTIRWALRFTGAGTFRVSRASVRKA